MDSAFHLKWRKYTKSEGTGEYRDASGDSLFWTLHLDYTFSGLPLAEGREKGGGGRFW